jgi:hypothetical protein
MPTYNEMFKSAPIKVDLIKRAIRQQIRCLWLLKSSTQRKVPEPLDNHNKIMELLNFSGYRHKQKTGCG